MPMEFRKVIKETTMQHIVFRGHTISYMVHRRALAT